mgnify:CR=1 FL=1
MENIDFKAIAYLENGNALQQKTFRIISEYNILQILKEYHPLVVGTIPINIDIENSDVDIILQTDHVEKLQEIILLHFQQFDDFSVVVNEKASEKIDITGTTRIKNDTSMPIPISAHLPQLTGVRISFFTTESFVISNLPHADQSDFARC